ncbi:HD domain-containing protein [Candidatus Palauibacter sp.]|uniref:HD domain-containing protein n=1 Tax=Candidatus Palauibacter sp. TaxID=3101350 RepID=UPI003B5CDBCC
MAKLHSTIHPIIHAAGAEQRHPAWAVMSDRRRRHTERVGELLWDWSGVLGHGTTKRIRWRAAGLLHDVLKGESPKTLRPEVVDLDDAEEWPGSLLHGPACANRLRSAGVDDEPLLMAIAHHTTGHSDFRALGQALYMADYLEPGRRGLVPERAEWRRRMPRDWYAVLGEIATAKIGTLLERRIPIPAITAGFWQVITAPEPPPGWPRTGF